jgi:hypothetical protein
VAIIAVLAQRGVEDWRAPMPIAAKKLVIYLKVHFNSLKVQVTVTSSFKEHFNSLISGTF